MTDLTTEQAALVFRSRRVSLSPLTAERPCPLVKGGGLCYHFKGKEQP
jgi:hypothetical protein